MIISLKEIWTIVFTSSYLLPRPRDFFSRWPILDSSVLRSSELLLERVMVASNQSSESQAFAHHPKIQKKIVGCRSRMEGEELRKHRESAWNFWRSIGSPKFTVAPMVNASELPFRLLSRNHGATLCYTPMINTVHVHKEGFLKNFSFQTIPHDRPLFAQICGNDADILIKAAKMMQDQCDAIDINLGQYSTRLC